MPSPNVILDPSSDKSMEELARLVKLYSFPEFVKRADLAATMQPPIGVVTTFADPRFRRYNCHSPAATWLSGLYFQEKKANYHPKDQARIQERLEYYADYHRIRPEYDSMVKQAAEINKEAELPDDAYAYIWADPESGHRERHLPMRSAPEVKAAADWLSEYRDRLPYHDRNTIARRILEKAARFGAAIGAAQTDWLEKQAGMGVCDPPEVVQLIQNRAKLAGEPVRAELLKLAAIVRDKPRVALQPEQLVKLAVTLDMADEYLGLQGKYTEHLPAPEEVIFKCTFTKAATDHKELCPLTTGNVYSKTQFEKLSRDDVESLFGSDFAAEVCTGLTVDGEKMAELAHTLPRPDAEVLERLLTESGLLPQMQKAASVGHGMSLEELDALAAVYSGAAPSASSATSRTI